MKAVLLLASAYEGKPTISIVAPADFMAFRITIRSHAESLTDQLRDVQNTRQTLADLAAKSDWRLHFGSPVVLTENYRKFSSMRGSDGEFDAHADLLLLANLDGNVDLFSLIRRVRLAADKLSVPKKITVHVQGNWLGVEDPERFRGELLKRVRLHLDTTAEALGGQASMEITGLDESIMARQFDERQVELSLPLSVRYKRESGSPSLAPK